MENKRCPVPPHAVPPHEAESFLKTNQNITEDYDLIFHLATNGMLEFKKGNFEEGRRLYLESIQHAEKKHDNRLIAKAYIYLALAEIEARTQESMQFANRAFEISDNIESPDIVLSRQILKNVWGQAIVIKY